MGGAARASDSTSAWGDWQIDAARAAKGRLIAATPGAIERVRDDLFFVKSQSGSGSYRVRLGERGPECSCKDYASRSLPCKHSAAVRYYLAKQTQLPLGETLSERIPITYPQAWAAYDRAQTEEVRLFDMLLRDLVAGVPEPERNTSKGGRPPIPLTDQLFCAIQKVYSHLSCRRARGLLGFAVERGQLLKARHYTISSEVLNKESVTPILQHLVTLSALPLAALEQGFAPDSTGIQTTSFGAWREEKHGEKRERVWIKAHALAGTKTHIVAAVSVTGKDGGDNPQFEPLVRLAAEAGLPLKEVFGDKAYSARANYALAEELGFDLYVPFRSNMTGRITFHGTADERARSHSALWRKAFYFCQMHREEFEAKYHARSNVESVFSALKRKFGETLKSKNRTAQINELLAKVLAYNLTVLIHEVFEHGILPDFLSEQTTRQVQSITAVGESVGV